jgi:rod shape-determining protein MreC
MMRRGSQIRATSYFVIAVALAIVLISVGQSLHFEAARSVTSNVLSPLQGFVSGITNGVGGTISTIRSIGDLANENKQLKQQVADLRHELADQQLSGLTDEQLKAMLGLRDNLHIRTVAADVIGLDPEGLTQTMTIHAGSKQGVRQGMSVLGQHGLVGRVISVQSNTAGVRLISDPQLPVNVELAGNHLGGTLTVANAQLVDQILGAPTDVKINRADLLVTSGLGGNYPKGLPVAAVSKFQYRPAEITQTAEVAPLDDLAHLEYVMVDLDFVPEGGQ